MLLGQPAKCLHTDTLNSIFGGLRQVRVCTYPCKNIANRWLLRRISHIHVKQLLVEARLFGQASLCQHVSRQFRSKRLFFLCDDFFLGKGFGGSILGLTRAGETHLLRCTCFAALRNLGFQLSSLAFRLRQCRLGCHYGVFSQPHIVRTVDEVALTVSQVCVGEALQLQGTDKRFGDVLDLRLNDRE